MDYRGKTAFITGGANGAGFGQARYFGGLGCRIFIADIRGDALAQALEALRGEGIEAEGAQLDLMDREAYARVADTVEETYGGPPELLFNTAGVFAHGPTEASTYEDFDWVFGVNLGGVVNGMVTMVPRMIKAGRPGHIVTTSSLGGFRGGDGAALYSAAKAAVISLMEGYRGALEKYDIGVSVLCPANINSNIALSSDTRPAHLKRSGYVVNEDSKQALKDIYQHGMDPMELAENVRKGIDANALYIIPYPEAKEGIAAHFAEIVEAFPPLESDPEGAKKRTEALIEWAGKRRDIFTAKSKDAPV
ncbi:SDR family NAD(P)-dependent oxidoreductase [Parasphingopyxis marina]|uniref:SDR family NAD(P)-dependent oxidoreductase n=1 Tax=Parasphingopyxis marina TaxID=2761622 RepID=A0A842HWD3_9SPHN|nr:SDR family NAD(P)-dependent oxidoreductase [Parasphingopyxis marina]MBC2776783.1 SDR family NAD(P)-dependent oxidoreductase [Parasphingopyxis marina]